ncbi:hypothetical protein PENTCL1PPCAC_26081, partial [Pristionchus entomophagus]
ISTEWLYDLDPSILLHRPADLVVYDNTVLPRIGYDIDCINVSVGELRRRIYGPERLSASLVCAYIRKAKNKDTLPDMRANLDKHGITLFNRSKKAIQPNSWTSLSEKEAMDMARETGHFLAFLPSSTEMRDSVRERPIEAEWLRVVAGSIAEAMFRVGATPEERRIETLADLHLFRFAMVSHHFGHSF